ncbi:MAG: glycosyltransferase family 2 protein [Bacteroidales bacterium]|nr:glycosyltransferase family 2 protein [Bacteroidales bacterium]
MSRITVLMPAYNVGAYIKEAIESVLAQTFKDFTLFVIDDCSTDNTAEVVHSFSDPRIRYEKNEHNLGLAENLNRGLELSDTELCARMDGDDIAEPNWLETGVKILDTHPEVGICSFGFQFFGTKTSVVRFPEHNEDSKAQMLFGCTVIVPVFRRSVMAENGFRYSTEAFPAEDYMMWSHCYRVTQVYNVQATLFHYRMHETQISTSKRIAQQEKSDLVRLRMLEWLNPDFSEEEKSFFLQKFVPGKIERKEDVATLQRFADLLVRHNVLNHYDNDALLRKFKMHIAYSTLSFVEYEYFPKGYSLCRYMRFVTSGLSGIIPVRNRRKILAKSLLMKKK